MKKITFSLLTAGLAVLFTSGCFAESEPRTVTVSASGHVEAVPDTITLSLEVRYTEKSIDAAGTKADQTARQVVQLARKAGIEKDDIDSSRMSAFPEYRWSREERQYLGETVQRTITLKIRTLENYGVLAGQLSELKLHGISPPRLSHSNIERLQLEALKRALDRATLKAEVIADQLDEDLGDVLQVQEATSRHPAPRAMMAEARAADNDASPVFNFAKTRIDASVTMTFELE